MIRKENIEVFKEIFLNLKDYDSKTIQDQFVLKRNLQELYLSGAVGKEVYDAVVFMKIHYEDDFYQEVSFLISCCENAIEKDNIDLFIGRVEELKMERHLDEYAVEALYLLLGKNNK